MHAAVPRVAKVVLIATLKLIVAGCVIGLLHRHDGIIACILAAYIIWKWPTELAPKGSLNAILVSGMAGTGALGAAAEWWGIHQRHWTYHDLSDGRSFPYWLPLAWALSFYYMYRLERQILAHMKPTLIGKFVIFFLVALLFPVVGEIVTIALGVWEYHWSWQIAGVPLIAMAYLVALHMSVNGIFLIICRTWRISDPVFSLACAARNAEGTS